MLRIIAATAGGVVAAMLIIIGLQWIGQQVVPVPAGVDPADPDVAQVPLPAMTAMLGAWFLGTLGGGAIANHLARRNWPCWIVAGLVLCGIIWQFMENRQPIAMVIGGFALPLLAAWIVSRLVPRPAPETP